jgi:hypothetical protein
LQADAAAVSDQEAMMLVFRPASDRRGRDARCGSWCGMDVIADRRPSRRPHLAEFEIGKNMRLSLSSRPSPASSAGMSLLGGES